MCGRIALYTPPARLAAAFGAHLADDVDPDAPPRFNVGPTSQVLALTATPQRHDDVPGRADQGKPSAPADVVLGRFRWGLVPSWAKDPSIGSRLFNARGETVRTKPSFRAGFRSRHAAIVADGFMEWRSEGRIRQPYFFRRSDGDPLALAGLWERWHAPAAGAPDLVTCTIITTDAGPDVAHVHDRMPVILERDDIDQWLVADGSQDDQKLLRPAEAGVLVGFPIDRRVGNVRNDDPGVIEPISRTGGPADGPGG